ncbi:MAG: ATP-binding protein [Bdellovibrionales bacterium]|nr:ATP-binding protein [Bdellovibrionales bacterium]
MKINSFWFKYALLMIGIILISSIAVSLSLSHFYAAENNQNTLKELQSQSIQSRNALVGDLKLLISSLVTWQSKDLTKDAPFSLVGVIDKTNGKVISVKPTLSKTLQQLKLPAGYLKKFPVAFYPLKTTNQRSARVLFLVDTDQIRSASLPKELSKQKVLFGLLSSKGFSLLSQSLKYYRDAFLLNQQSWMPIHSQMAYSGWFLQTPFLKNFKNYADGWEHQSGETLTVGAPVGISDSYLVLNRRSQKWSEHFNAIFSEVLLVLFGIGMLMIIPVYLFINPLCSAYLYLARLLNRYAVWNVFPAPNHKGNNTYIRDIQPHLEKLYWQLREEKLSSVKEPIQHTQLFSDMVQNICNNILNYPNVQIKTHFESDIQIPQPSHWLEQSIIEIVKNSAECMDENGTIEIHTLREKGQFLCRIRDYGPGMSPMMMNQVCKAYYSSKPKSKGLGLTLAYAALSRAGCPLYFSNAKDGQKGLIVEIAVPEKSSYSTSHIPIYDSSHT